MKLGLFNEAEDEKDSALLESVIFEEPIKKTRKEYKRKKLYKGLANHDQLFKLEESKQICPIEKFSV